MFGKSLLQGPCRDQAQEACLAHFPVGETVTVRAQGTGMAEKLIHSGALHWVEVKEFLQELVLDWVWVEVLNLE